VAYSYSYSSAPDEVAVSVAVKDADLAEVMVKVEGEEPRAAGPPLNVLGTMQPSPPPTDPLQAPGRNGGDVTPPMTEAEYQAATSSQFVLPNTAKDKRPSPATFESPKKKPLPEGYQSYSPSGLKEAMRQQLALKPTNLVNVWLKQHGKDLDNGALVLTDQRLSTEDTPTTHTYQDPGKAKRLSSAPLFCRYYSTQDAPEACWKTKETSDVVNHGILQFLNQPQIDLVQEAVNKVGSEDQKKIMRAFQEWLIRHPFYVAPQADDA